MGTKKQVRVEAGRKEEGRKEGKKKLRKSGNKNKIKEGWVL